ncbi:hypothetical protein [Natronomonas sp.]|uniref:hypothetical protein n=1 Tax=Natronomonas sp. TaxID=2184060 RepID=UPI002FC278DC
MAEQSEKTTAEKVGRQTGRDPIVVAAAGSVLLAWYQYYVRGNKEHGLFIGLWPPTMLAFSNALQLNDLSREAEAKTTTLYDWVTNR